jgi:opacity protein-like surface antigen
MMSDRLYIFNLTIMKKYWILTTFFIAIFTHGQGQTRSLEYGFSAGMNINSASGSAVNKTYSEPLLGFNVGGHIKLNTSKRFGIKAILRYEQQGWAYRSLTFENNTGTTIGKGDVLFKLNYLNLPLLAEYSFGNKLKFTLGGGLFVGFLLNNQIITKINEPVAPNPVTITKNRSDFRKATNFGLSFSAGVQIPVSHGIQLSFNLHENYGLQNINKSQGLTNTTIKTNTLAINAGVVFKRR